LTNEAETERDDKRHTHRKGPALAFLRVRTDSTTTNDLIERSLPLNTHGQERTLYSFK